MRADIISIGTELLLGQITDTNAPYIAAELPLLGIDLYWITQVGDNRARILEALGRALDRSEVVICTGGLGPTEDDVTREAIAELLGEDMHVDPALEEWLRRLFKGFGLEMPDCNIKQANLIPSAEAIPNSRGTAPGWWVEREGKVIAALPGPPDEMQFMWQNSVKPRLRLSPGQGVIVSRTLKTLGFSEARVNEMVREYLCSSNPTLGIYAKLDGIHLRLTAKAGSRAEAEEAITLVEARLKDLFGRYIWGYDEDTLETLVGSLLREKKLNLAVMESCTGGLLASTITDVPGSSEYFKGGLVTYSAEMKAAFGVDAGMLARVGTVHPDVAVAMAGAARAKLGADIGIGITGVAGPSEVEGKPVGTVHIAVDVRGDASSLSLRLPPRRIDVKRRAVFSALFMLRQRLL
ncbi:MAG: competence/damage-inducible protein A [Dehalococcoidia bacterium]|nr:competence/damage-inducible protein A [Dehalococcoidia bacterium]